MLQEWIAVAIAFAERHALALALFGALAENTFLLGLLTPGGAIVALAAAGARSAGLPLPLIVAAGAAGMTGGALLDYLLGRAGVHRLLTHPRAGRTGRRLAAQLELAASLLNRHGWWVVLLAHTWSHARTSVALAAGGGRLPIGRFLAFEVPAALLWSTFWCLVGSLFAASYERFGDLLQRAGWVAMAGVVAVILLQRWWQRRRQHRHGAGRARAS